MLNRLHVQIDCLVLFVPRNGVCSKGLQNILLLRAGLNPSGIKLLFRSVKIVTGRGGGVEWIPVQFFCLNRSPTKKLKEDSIWDEKLQRMAGGTIQHFDTCKKLNYKLCKQIVFFGEFCFLQLFHNNTTC